MSYYLETPVPWEKASWLCKEYNASIIPQPDVFNPPPGKAFICVVDNTAFEAAAYCCNEYEFRIFTRLGDGRPKTWLLMDQRIASLKSGHYQAMKMRHPEDL